MISLHELLQSLSCHLVFPSLSHLLRHRVKARLAADHAAVLNPTVDTPFSDIDDVVARLLPYHVFQQPKEDLEYLTDTGKGKRKAAATDLETEVKGRCLEFSAQTHTLKIDQKRGLHWSVINDAKRYRSDSDRRGLDREK